MRVSRDVRHERALACPGARTGIKGFTALVAGSWPGAVRVRHRVLGRRPQLVTSGTRPSTSSATVRKAELHTPPCMRPGSTVLAQPGRGLLLHHPAKGTVPRTSPTSTMSGSTPLASRTDNAATKAFKWRDSRGGSRLTSRTSGNDSTDNKNPRPQRRPTGGGLTPQERTNGNAQPRFRALCGVPSCGPRGCWTTEVKKLAASAQEAHPGSRALPHHVNVRLRPVNARGSGFRAAGPAGVPSELGSRSGAAQAMGACLGPVAAYFHGAPLTRTVSRVVVERPPAVVRRTDLDPVHPVLHSNRDCGCSEETRGCWCAQLDLAIHAQPHLQVDAAPSLTGPPAGQSPQVGA